MSDWNYCPECGSKDCKSSGSIDGKWCLNCDQEWFTDLDYTDVVCKHLSERAEMQAAIRELVEAVKQLDRFGKYDLLLNNTKKWSEG